MSSFKILLRDWYRLPDVDSRFRLVRGFRGSNPGPPQWPPVQKNFLRSTINCFKIPLMEAIYLLMTHVHWFFYLSNPCWSCNAEMNRLWSMFAGMALIRSWIDSEFKGCGYLGLDAMDQKFACVWFQSLKACECITPSSFNSDPSICGQ